MRREIIFLLLAVSLAAATLDQTYAQTVDREGDSVIVKSTDLSLLMGQLGEGSLAKLSRFCESDGSCSVEGNTVTITEEFSPGSYYTFTAEHGIPFSQYTYEIRKIPADRFGQLLDKLLLEAGVIDETGDVLDPIDLSDKESNGKDAEDFRRFNVNINYSIVMPGSVSEAHAGNASASIEGSKATFDVVEVMADSEPMVVKSSELNLGVLVLIAGIIIVAGLAVAFKKSKPKRRKK